MVGLLYRGWLCLAIAEKSEKTYTLQACLPLDNCGLEEADNGRGMCSAVFFASMGVTKVEIAYITN